MKKEKNCDKQKKIEIKRRRGIGGNKEKREVKRERGEG